MEPVVDRRSFVTRQEPHGDGSCIRWSEDKSSRTSWNAGHPGVSVCDLDYFVLERQRREFEFEKLRQQQQFVEWKQQMEERRTHSTGLIQPDSFILPDSFNRTRLTGHMWEVDPNP